MRIKLKAEAAKELYNMLDAVLPNAVPVTPDDRLIILIMRKVYQKLWNKLIEPKKKYSLNLNDTDALAYYIFFRDTKRPGLYEAAIIASHMLLIQEHFNQSTYLTLTK